MTQIQHSQRLFFRYSEHSWSAYWFQLIILHKQHGSTRESVTRLPVHLSLCSQPASWCTEMTANSHCRRSGLSTDWSFLASFHSKL